MSKFILFLFNLLLIHNFCPTKCVIIPDYIFWWTILHAKCILTSKFHAVEATTIYYYSWFQSFAVLWILCIFFWAFPRHQIKFCRRFGTLCQVHLQRHHTSSLWRWTWQRFSKRRQNLIWCRGKTQEKIHKIQKTAKLWNQELRWS
jgi:hypothetical protein